MVPGEPEITRRDKLRTLLHFVAERNHYVPKCESRWRFGAGGSNVRLRSAAHHAAGPRGRVVAAGTHRLDQSADTTTRARGTSGESNTALPGNPGLCTPPAAGNQFRRAERDCTPDTAFALRFAWTNAIAVTAKFQQGLQRLVHDSP